MLEKFLFALVKESRLERDQPLGVGFSGGPDSLCLLHLLVRQGFQPLALHLDHSIRPESAGEAAHARELAQELGVPFIDRRVDVPGLAAEQRLSIEEAARQVRYRFLFEQAERLNAQAVLTAHNADDQVETVLMHLLRGSGTAGLRGMPVFSLPNPWSARLALIRPLLGVWRDEILAYVQENGLSPILDASNADSRFYRNRLRNETIPYLQTLNPQFKAVLWRTAGLARDDYALLEALADQAWQEGDVVQGEGYVGLSAAQLARLEPALQRMVLRRAISLLRPALRDVDFETVERLRLFLSDPPASYQADLAANLKLRLEGERLWLADWEAGLPGADWPQLLDETDLLLPIPGEIALTGGWRLKARQLEPAEAVGQEIEAAGPNEAFLDAEALREAAQLLSVRTRRPGDRFRPLGLGGRSQKLSDFMINVKLPQRARDRWPLVVAGQEIAWLPGFRPAEPFRVGPQTAQIVHLQLLPPIS